MDIEDCTGGDAPTDAGSDGDDRCNVCGGSRVIEVDAFTPSRGHFTTAEECDACTSDDFADLDERANDLDPLEKWWPRNS